jgi:hypothetical protein
MNRTERRVLKRSDLKTLKTKKVVFDEHRQMIKHRQRKYNEKDKFSFFYNTTYKTNINMQGNLGDIIVYLDYYIHEEVLALYYNQEEFIFQYDKKMVKDKGIDFYLGHILKTVETQYEERIKDAEDKKIEVKREGNAETLKVNPGMVTYDDLKAYLAEKNKNRYSN